MAPLLPVKKTEQTSIDSFFGTTKAASTATKKGGPKQKKMESFFTSKQNSKTALCASEVPNSNAKEMKSMDHSLSRSSAVKAAAEPAASKRKTPDNAPVDDDDDEDSDVPVQSAVRKTKTAAKRRVIQDESDDEEVEAKLFGGKEAAPEATAATTTATKDNGITMNERVQEETSTDELMLANVSEEKEEDGEKPSSAAFDSKKVASDGSPLKAAPLAKIIKASAKVVDSSSVKISAKKTTSSTATKVTAAIKVLPKKGKVVAKSASSVKSKDATAKKAGTKSESKEEDATDDDDDEEEEMSAPASKSTKSAIVKTASKSQYKTDEEVLKEISSTTWDGEMPYSVLCQAFGQIEAVTSRLAIQEIMTTLFRQIMLKSCSDMSTVLYLASNSVAAAYECVELGIGDALLIKAIGQATGTNPAMVKTKYETVGDLGSVAQSFKSKQSTLGGFFAVSKKTTKDYLTAAEVLKTFRQIAETKGNHSQTFKVNNIKKLLVHTTDPVETKYIIRGLQGKLRIGLAQSTVLISLAHALALTVPKTIDVAAVKEDGYGTYFSLKTSHLL